MKENVNGVILFDKSEKNLLPLAKEKLSNGDLEGALFLYLEIERSGKFPVSLYRSIAQTYTDLQMYSESVNYWFKYLNYVSERHYAEAYNGLGGNFYLMGITDVAAYYFNLQITNEEDDEYPFDDYLYEIFGLINEENTNIRLVDVQGDVDKKNIKIAKKEFEKNPELAYSLLKQVDKESSQYENACITLAAFYIIERDYENAVKKYNEITENCENYKFALNNLFGAYYCIGDQAGVEDSLNKLMRNNMAEFDQLVKFFHLMRSESDAKKCYDYCLLLTKLFKTPRLYFYLGVCAYNCKKYVEAFDYFISYFKVTGNYVAKYNAEASLARQSKSKDYPNRLDFSLLLPEIEVAKLEKKAPKYLTQTKRTLKKNIKQIFEFSDACFSTNSPELQVVACQLLSFIGGAQVEKYLKNLLLNHKISDQLKSVIVTVLVELENDKTTGMVYANVYSRLEFEKTQFSDDLSGLFLSAYALAFGKMSPFDESELYKLQISAYELFYSLQSNGNLIKVNDLVALATFIAINAEMEINLKIEEIIEYFGTTAKNLKRIIKLVTSE